MRTEKPETELTTVRVTPELHQQWRDAAWKTRTTMRAFVTEALAEAIRKLEKEKSAA
jgi:predicted HicB family RNase H-like nuclease